MNTLTQGAQVLELREKAGSSWVQTRIVDDGTEKQLQVMRKGEDSWSVASLLTYECIDDLLMDMVIRIAEDEAGKRTYTFQS